jgi:hypothetical protein
MKKYFIITFVFLIFFELSSMIFSKLGLLMFNEKPKYSYEAKFLHDWIEKDDDGIIWHKKNYKTRHVSRCFDVEYETNNIGARDYNDYSKDEKISSLLLIGDSFAEGPGVNIDKIFAKLVEKKINKKVLNFGNSGTEPQSQFIRYSKFVNDYNFDELIYFFLPSNDYTSPLQSELEEIDRTKKETHLNLNFGKVKYYIVDFLSRFTYSYNFIRSASYLLDVNFDYGFKNLSYFYKNKKNIDHTFDYLNKLINIKKVKSYIIIIPTNYDISNFQKSNENYKDLYWYKEIAKIAINNNSVLIDLMDYVDFKKKPFYFHSCDGHWSEYGNSFAANVFINNYNN